MSYRLKRVYTVVRVTTIIETCLVGMPTKKSAKQWAKASDAVREEHSTGWIVKGFKKEYARDYRHNR